MKRKFLNLSDGSSESFLGSRCNLSCLPAFPRPGAFLINHMFSNTVQITDKTFDQAEKRGEKQI